MVFLLEPSYDLTQCEDSGGELLNDDVCLFYIPGLFSWPEAVLDAQDKGGVVTAVEDVAYHDVSVALLRQSGSPRVWLGGRGNLQGNLESWSWIRRT